MFDFAWSELALIGALSVLLLGPKQLPETMRTLAKLMRKVRGLSAEFQGHFNEMVREAELEELRAQVQKLSAGNLQSEVSKAIDPTGEIEGALRLDPAAEAFHATTEAEALAVEQTALQPDPAAPQIAAAPAAPSPTVEPAIQPPQTAVAAPQPPSPPAAGPAA